MELELLKIILSDDSLTAKIVNIRIESEVSEDEYGTSRSSIEITFQEQDKKCN